MYKVMIADDERWIITGLKKIIDWEKLSLEVAYTATNGEEALCKFKQDPVDIVIADINMPKLNGLDLLKSLKSLNENTKFIILSGYDEFAYAKEAISIGVYGYALKPFDETEIENLLKTCVAKLKNDYHLIDITKKDILMKLVNGTKISDTELNLIKNMKSKEAYSIAIIKPDLDDYTDEKISEIIKLINTFKSGVDIEIFYEIKEELIILNGWNIYVDEQEVTSYYSQLQSFIESNLNLETFIAISNIVTNLSDIKFQYNLVKSLMMFFIIKGFDTIVTSELVELRKSQEISVDLSKLHKLIIEQNQTEVIKYIENILINNVKQNNISPDYLYHICVKIAVLLDEIIRDFRIQNTDSIYILRVLIEKIYKANNIAVLSQLLIQQIKEVMNIIGKDNSKYSPVIQQVINDIHNYYYDDLNLTILANKYNMNSSYLGRLFLKEVGTSFAQYLNEVKNSKAKDLILNTNMKMNEIAKSVGYYEISYFYRKFKKIYGVSPATLREMKTY